MAKACRSKAVATILEAAATVGIKIPTLCWLQKVSPTGACRICAVEIEGVDRTMTACNTPVKEGINGHHQLAAAAGDAPQGDGADAGEPPAGLPGLRRRRRVRPAGRLLRSEGDQAGVLGHPGAPRHPLRLASLESDPNRCILCEKCVKVDHEVVGCDAIAVVNKGEDTIIDTVDGKPLNCEFCGNCVAACPTGALITKPFKFKGRPWAFATVPSVCAFLRRGCQIEYHAKEGRVARVTSDDAPSITATSASTAASATAISARRTGSPHRCSGQRRGAGCQRLEHRPLGAAGKLQEIIARDGAAAVAGLGSPRVTNEESFLFQKFLRAAVGSNNIDSEARLGFAQAQSQMLRRFGFSGASTPSTRSTRPRPSWSSGPT